MPTTPDRFSFPDDDYGNADGDGDGDGGSASRRGSSVHSS